MLDARRREAFRRLAADTAGIDVEVYRQLGKDPLEPILGLGAASAPVCFFGRDPGREEVRHGAPFVGASGQSVRRALHRQLYGTEPADFDAALAVGRGFFWLGTVPYKPQGNRAWSMAVKRRFQPLLRELLLSEWRGRLEAFWRRDDRFSASIDVQLHDEHGALRDFVLHPLPHPSPLNQLWFKRFPALLQARLAALAIGAPPVA
ncbi:uracil-DNA glycosylase [Pseudomonas sp. JL972]|uniref:uracil-DNA glycosylase family protein n=1 Tax=Stutzerimonas degradans TaxID=2968968 RepID=UPI00157E74CF|nr:uracil-DNA glycosylase [Stutzerimonas degradans]